MMTVDWDRAYGAFLGVLCGDAAGAVLEFFDRADEQGVTAAMHMPGGGFHGVGPGQITDDSELALSLAQGLVDSTPNNGFPVDAVAARYRAWYESKPYDIGNTCANAFKGTLGPGSGWGQHMITRSAEYNSRSEANGSLMRVLPLALWAWDQPKDVIAAMAKQDATLSHPNQVCQDANAVYCLAITHLITHPGDHLGAIAVAKQYVMEHVHTRVKEWFPTESLDISTICCTDLIGHVRWAFVLSIHFLRTNTRYEQAIHKTLLQGGDTDTNAAIVGGMMGALHGVDAFPEYMRGPVLAFDCQAPPNAQGIKRPAAYRAMQVETLTKQLVRL